MQQQVHGPSVVFVRAHIGTFSHSLAREPAAFMVRCRSLVSWELDDMSHVVTVVYEGRVSAQASTPLP